MLAHRPKPWSWRRLKKLAALNDYSTKITNLTAVSVWNTADGRVSFTLRAYAELQRGRFGHNDAFPRQHRHPACHGDRQRRGGTWPPRRGVVAFLGNRECRDRVVAGALHGRPDA